MKLHERGILNSLGKSLAKPLSHLVSSPITIPYATLAEGYLCILLGKGAGTGWALDAEVQAADALVRHPAPIIFDVGANVGDWAAAMHQRRPTAQIFMFEPQPECQRVIRERNMPGAHLIPKAVSSVKNQTVQLFTDGDGSGIGSLHPRRDSYFSDMTFTPILVDTLTIDDIIAEHQLPRVDFMKMDIEGHELDALKGAVHHLANHTIKALSFEFGSGNVNSRTFFRDYWDLLTPFGYSLYRLLPSSRLLPIKEYYEDCEYFRGATNYIATLAADPTTDETPHERQ